MPDSRISLPIQKFLESTKELFSMDKDFPAPPQPDQQEPTELEKKQEGERQLRMRYNYRHW